MKKFVRTLALSLSAVCAFVAEPAQAEDYPSRPVTLVVPNAPGGAIDILARLLSEKLQALWGQPIVIVNKPGAGTIMGTNFVAKSKPDGMTLGMVITGHMINPSLWKTIPFDTTKDLAGISLIATSQIVITATPSLPANNLADLIAMAKKNPKALTYASPGTGSSMHLTGELIKSEAGINMMHIPYKGSGPAYVDVMAGRVPLLIDPVFSSMSYIKSGKLKPIAVTGKERDLSLPNVPTVAETFPGLTVDSVFGLVAPHGTPRDIVQKISRDIANIVHTPDFEARMKQLSMTPVGNSPEEFDAYIAEGIQKWAKVVHASGATAN